MEDSGFWNKVRSFFRETRFHVSIGFRGGHGSWGTGLADVGYLKSANDAAESSGKTKEVRAQAFNTIVPKYVRTWGPDEEHNRIAIGYGPTILNHPFFGSVDIGG